MFKYAFLLLKQMLESIPEIPSVMWYASQYDESVDEAVFYCPACYIEFLPIEPDQNGLQVQSGDMVFRVHLFTEYYNDDDQILSHFELSDLIYQKLQGSTGKASDIPAYANLAGTPEDFNVLNKISRIGIIPDHAVTNTSVTIQEFLCRAIDLAAAIRYVLVNADIEVIRP